MSETNAQPSPAEASAPMHGPTWKSRRAWLVLLLALLGSLVADLGSKSLAFRYVAGHPVNIIREDVLAVADPRFTNTLIPPHPPVVVVPGVLDFTLVLNPGAVFGTGPGWRWFFVGFTLVAISFAGLMFARWSGPKDHWVHAGIGMLVGGGLGNLYDRLMYACVRDFLHPLPGVKWPFGLRLLGRDEVWPYVSNVADALLLVGIGILLVFLWRHDRR